MDNMSGKDRSISSLFPAITQKSSSIIERIKQNNVKKKNSEEIRFKNQITIQDLIKRKKDSMALSNHEE